MSDNKHTGQIKHQYWIDQEISNQLDELIKKYGYTSRTEWYRDMIRQELHPIEPAARATRKASQN